MRSLQEVLRHALDEARDLFTVGKQSGNVQPEVTFEDFCAIHLVQILTPLMTAIQQHVLSCSPFKHELQEVHDTAVEMELPVANVIGTISMDGAALPPFYTRKTQEEIGSQFASRYHTGE